MYIQNLFKQYYYLNDIKKKKRRSVNPDNFFKGLKFVTLEINPFVKWHVILSILYSVKSRGFSKFFVIVAQSSEKKNKKNIKD